MTEGFSIFGDPAAVEIARQGGYIRDAMRRADQRVEHVAAEWERECQRIAYERDCAIAREQHAVKTHNDLVKRYDRIWLKLGALEKEHEVLQAHVARRETDVAALEAEVAELKKEVMDQILANIRRILNEP